MPFGGSNMSKRRVFGELECAILSLVEEKGPLSVKEVQKLLGNKDQYTTIMTVMVRLTEKGKLKREKEGRQYFYRLAPKSSKKSVLQGLKHRLLGVRPVQLVAHLLESSDALTDEEIEDLENLIREAKRKR